MAGELVDRDAEHLNLLSILQYASAGVTAVVGSFPLIHVTIGAVLALLPDSLRGSGKDAFPRLIGFFFMGIGLLFVTAGWSLAAAHFFTARFLRQRRHYVFCVAVSLVSCLACMFSSGIVSIATLVVLFRPGVRELFDREASSAEPSVP
jgi:hypothetical protein